MMVFVSNWVPFLQISFQTWFPKYISEVKTKCINQGDRPECKVGNMTGKPSHAIFSSYSSKCAQPGHFQDTWRSFLTGEKDVFWFLALFLNIAAVFSLVSVKRIKPKSCSHPPSLLLSRPPDPPSPLFLACQSPGKAESSGQAPGCPIDCR